MMKPNTREVFIKIQNVKEIVTLLSEIESSNKRINSIVPKIEDLKQKEEMIMDNWISQLEEIEDKIEHITL